MLTSDMTMDQKQQRSENSSFQETVCTASAMLMWLMCEVSAIGATVDACPFTSSTFASVSSSCRAVTRPTLESLVLPQHTCSIGHCSKLQSMSDISYSALVPVIVDPSGARAKVYQQCSCSVAAICHRTRRAAHGFKKGPSPAPWSCASCATQDGSRVLQTLHF